MNDDKGIMKVETVLPKDFDGTFPFTNWTDEEFVGVWGKKEYHFAPNSTARMIMPEHSPLEVQQIRKKFAKDLAEREFFKGSAYGKLLAQERNSDGSVRLNSIQQAGTYSINELTPFIQRCLEPLPVSNAVVNSAPSVNVEDALTRNDEGDLNTQVVDRKTSLRKKALEA